jgi:hypothetical protein
MSEGQRGFFEVIETIRCMTIKITLYTPYSIVVYDFMAISPEELQIIYMIDILIENRTAYLEMKACCSIFKI